MMKHSFPLALVWLCILVYIITIEAQRRGGGGFRSSSSSRGSSRSSSRPSSSSWSRPSTSSSSSAGWRSPSSSSSSSPTSSPRYGWRTPTVTSRPSSPTYGWTNPPPATIRPNSPTYGWTNPTPTSRTIMPTFRPPTNTGTSFSQSTNRFLLSPGHRSSGRGTAARLGVLAGASRFRTRTRYRGGGFSFESSSIEDSFSVPTRVIVLGNSERGTCAGLVTRQNRTTSVAALTNTSETSLTTVNVTIYEHENFSGRSEVVELAPRQCLNLYLIEPKWNDEVSSIKLPGNGTCVMIWEHKDCTGKFACFTNGSRGSDRMTQVGMNDMLTSMQLC